jgi:YD repeat-containing protein
MTGLSVSVNAPRYATNFTAKNRLALGAGGYDLAGNQLRFAPSTLTYDGENHVREVTSASNGSASYRYDGEGRRVKKTVGGSTVRYVYDASGQLAAEYGSPAVLGCATCYLTQDPLGSTRMVTNQTSAVVERRDYLPFGEEMPVGARTVRRGRGHLDESEVEDLLSGPHRAPKVLESRLYGVTTPIQRVRGNRRERARL